MSPAGLRRRQPAGPPAGQGEQPAGQAAAGPGPRPPSVPFPVTSPATRPAPNAGTNGHTCLPGRPARHLELTQPTSRGQEPPGRIRAHEPGAPPLRGHQRRRADRAPGQQPRPDDAPATPRAAGLTVRHSGCSLHQTRGILADHGVTTALAVDRAPAEPQSPSPASADGARKRSAAAPARPRGNIEPPTSPRLRPLRPRHGTPPEPGAVRKVVTMVIAGVLRETAATLPRVPGPQ